MLSLLVLEEVLMLKKYVQQQTHIGNIDNA